MWGLYLILEISSAHRHLLCHNEMVVLSPITWKILIYLCSPGVTEQVLLVTRVELKSSLSSLWTKPIASSRRAFKSLSMHSVQSAHDILLKQVQSASLCLVIKAWFLFLQSCRNTDNEYICSRGGTEQVALYCIVGNFFYTSGTWISTVFTVSKPWPPTPVLGHDHWLECSVFPWWAMCSEVFLC